MKKKMLCVALALCMVMCLSPSLSFAADGIDISTTFTDANFRSYVAQNFDRDNNGYLSQLEVDAVTVINCADMNIASLTGIEVFTNLKELDCSGNALSALDVSRNTNLEVLNCKATNLEIVEVNHDDAGNLAGYKNCISSLNLSNNTKLKSVNCDWNELGSLDISNNKELRSLSCKGCGLTSLDVSQNTKLEELFCGWYSIKIWYKTFGDLYSFNNPLETINLGGNTSLKKLDIGSCDKITSIIEEQKNLVYLDCSFCNLNSLDVGKFDNLEYLNCYSNNLTELNTEKNKKLKYLDCGDNKISVLDFQNNTQLKHLNCSYNNSQSLRISKNAPLEYLDCRRNNIGEIDVSSCFSLEYLDCVSSGINELNLGKNKKLKELYCSSNAIAMIDLSKNTKLEVLDCGGTEIDELDVSKNSELKDLDCRNTRLTSLDVSNNTKLETLKCGYVDLWWGYWLDKPTTKINLAELPGTFEPEKASNWSPSGCTLEGSILTIPEGTDKVFYTYDCGNGKSGDFVLRIHMHPENATEWVSNGNGTHTRTSTCEAKGLSEDDVEYSKTERCSGGQATTTAKAVCSVCRGEYGELVKATYSGGGSSAQTELEKAKTEAKSEVKTEIDSNKYDDAEASEVKAIKEQADKDIAAAKTVEEVEKIKAEAEAKIGAIPTSDEKADKEAVSSVTWKTFKATSKKKKLNGKKAIKVTWTLPEGVTVDGYEVYRSTKKNSGYGTVAYFTTTKTSYTNNKALKAGKMYYYKVRGYKMINGEKVYTGWSSKAYRRV